MIINRNFPKIPPNGWHFDNYGERIVAKSPDALVTSVSKDRATRCLPLGDVENEIARYFATFDERFALPGNAVLSELQAESEMINRIWRYKLRLSRVADLRVTEQRETCAHCPHKRELNLGPNRNEYDSEAFARGCLLSSETDFQRLGTCSQYRWPIAIATRLEQPSKVALPGLVEGCWLRA